MEKPEYILSIEKKDDLIFSIMDIEIPENFDNFIKERKMLLVFSESSSDIETSEITYQNKIYQTQQQFFLYLSLTDGMMSIYYKEQQLNELTLFIRQLFKQFKNATINNKRT